MNKDLKIVYVLRYADNAHLLKLSRGKEIPASRFRGMDRLIDGGKTCSYVEVKRTCPRQVIKTLTHNDVILLNDALLSFALLNVFFRKKLLYLNISGSTLLRYKRGIKRAAFIMFLRLVDVVICISKTQMKDLEQVGVAPDRMRMVKFGVDTDFFDEEVNFLANFPNGYIVSIGRDRGRDFGSLFELATRLPDEQFVIATSKSRIPEGTPLPKNVTVQYDLSPVEVRKLYRGAKCCIITLKDDTSTEGSDCTGQTTVQETLSAGLPVFCTHRIWLDDYYEPSVHYLPLDQTDIAAMTHTVSTYLRTPEQLCAIGTQGKEETKRMLNTERFAQNLYQIFQDVYE